jgi:hypothetical protein
VNKQFILAAAGALLVASLFFFGKTSEPKKPMAMKPGAPEKMFDILTRHYTSQNWKAASVAAT